MPFNFEDLKLRQANGELSEECYESAIFRLEKELDELRTGGEKVRDVAALIAEELDMGQLLSDKAAKPKAVCKLVRPCAAVVVSRVREQRHVSLSSKLMSDDRAAPLGVR